MATQRRQPELPRPLSAAFSRALTLLGALALLTPLPAGAQVEPSEYSPSEGAPFFLLADRSFTPDETALVRLEVASLDFGLAAVERYGGVDVVVYRVPKPLEFLERQRNLHRVRIDAGAVPDDGEGLSNTLAYVWDSWWRGSRRAFRSIFSEEARKETVAQAPALATRPGFNAPTTFRAPPSYRPLAGFELAAQFRYPVHRAKPIEPPKGVHLEGSSSEFIEPSEGNVHIPIGRLTPGLYLVEAYVGEHRATTLVFASRVVAVTKGAAAEMLVWTADRTTGRAVPGVDLLWTDGVGVLARAKSDGSGLARMPKHAPERSYLLGADPDGGVLVSENFYFDAEIYDTKLYAVTDRPLYRPGDEVFVKIFARNFESARKSSPIASGEVLLEAWDPGGALVANRHLMLSAEAGGEARFRLPDGAAAGGYELRMRFRGRPYSAAFRVAEYRKPHFEVTLLPDKVDWKTKQPISGVIQLRYPDGKPVRRGEVELTVKSQKLSMFEGELRYYGQFPVQLQSESLALDEKGDARFALPPADEPSRYVLTVSATDGAAARVRTTKEILVERGRAAYSLRAEKNFSDPGESVEFAILPEAPGELPSSWEWIRLEDRASSGGTLRGDRLEIEFPRPGSYSLRLLDAHGNLVGAASHWVSGDGLKAPQGAIEIVLDRDRYRPGDTAEALVTFPEPVDEALLTLERDQVEKAVLLRAAKGWVSAKRLGPTQWRLRIPVESTHAPNVTLSVAYVKGGDPIFQNKGLLVAQPKIEVKITPARSIYAPGEAVEIELATSIGGRPTPAVVAVSVVDEAIYVLQPELAPDIHDFFFHPRRNNVRTSSSLAFISYDLSSTRSKKAPTGHSIAERRVKVLERPRRDEVDTAFWEPTLRTDAKGRAKFRFTMPDALARWRVTARAVAADGTVGQRRADLRSDKDLYGKWTAPNWMRQGDRPVGTLTLFNQTKVAKSVDVAFTAPGITLRKTLTVPPGTSTLPIEVDKLATAGTATVALTSGGRSVDRFETRLDLLPQAWPSPHSLTVPIDGTTAALDLPTDARNVRFRLVSSDSDQVARIVDDLLDYPYGCVEQTASRMVPMALALSAFGPGDERLSDRYRQQLHSARNRLAYLADPKARFAWWGDFMTEDPFLTTYAYWADWQAARALGAALPAEHWQRLLEVYASGGHALPPAQRALVLFFLQDMKLPIDGLLDGWLADLAKQPVLAAAVRKESFAEADSIVLGSPSGPLAQAYAFAVTERIAKIAGRSLPPSLTRLVDEANSLLATAKQPLAEALAILAGRKPLAEGEAVLERVSSEMPTFERSLTLVLLVQAMSIGPRTEVARPAPIGAWTRDRTASGDSLWRWPTSEPLPKSIQLASAAPGQLAVVQFESSSAETATLPATIERHLYRVVRQTEGRWRLEPVESGDVLATDELYLDEVVASPTGGTLRHLLVELPLPPGASIEETTWGITFGDDDQSEEMEKSRAQITRFGYAVPIEQLDGANRLRHLVRFAEPGTFSLPAARLYRMYRPGAKAFGDEDSVRSLEVK